jgi:hypothetical protein
LDNKSYVHLRTFEEDQSVDDKNICCFYDGYPIKGKQFACPKSYKNNTFFVWGYFCSYECVRSFIEENNKSCHVDKELSLLSLLSMKTYGMKYRLGNSKNRFLLKKFGGPLDIDQWRKENYSSRLWIIKAPKCERTYMTYDCVLNQNIEIMNVSVKKKDKDSNNKKVNLEKRSTPAHLTKKSLLSLVNKH